MQELEYIIYFKANENWYNSEMKYILQGEEIKFQII